MLLSEAFHLCSDLCDLSQSKKATGALLQQQKEEREE